MVIEPTRPEIEMTPEAGVFFYDALQELSSLSIQLAARYSELVTMSDIARELKESQPFLHEQFAHASDGEIAASYIQGAGKQDESEQRRTLRQEMAWRHRLREEAMLARDAADAIKRDVFGVVLERNFDGAPADQQKGAFLDRLISGLPHGQACEIGDGTYAVVDLPRGFAGDVLEPTFIRVQADVLIVFGSTLALPRYATAFVHEAKGEDCHQLICDMVLEKQRAGAVLQVEEMAILEARSRVSAQL